MGDNHVYLIATIEDHFNQLSNATQTLLNKDPNTVENVGIDLIAFLKKLKERIFVLLNSLEISVKQRSDKETHITFDRLSKAIADCKIYSGEKIIKVESDNEENISIQNSGNQKSSVDSVNILKNKLSLSLSKSSDISQETDDEGWVDSCQKIFTGDFPKPKKINTKEEDEQNDYSNSTIDINEFLDNVSDDDPNSKEYKSELDETVPLNDTISSSRIDTTEDDKPGGLSHAVPISRETAEVEEKNVNNECESENNSIKTDLLEKYLNSEYTSTESYDSDKTEILDESTISLSDHTYTRNSSVGVEVENANTLSLSIPEMDHDYLGGPVSFSSQIDMSSQKHNNKNSADDSDFENRNFPSESFTDDFVENDCSEDNSEKKNISNEGSEEEIKKIVEEEGKSCNLKCVKETESTSKENNNENTNLPLKNSLSTNEVPSEFELANLDSESGGNEKVCGQDNNDKTNDRISITSTSGNNEGDNKVNDETDSDKNKHSKNFDNIDIINENNNFEVAMESETDSQSTESYSFDFKQLDANIFTSTLNSPSVANDAEELDSTILLKTQESTCSIINNSNVEVTEDESHLQKQKPQNNSQEEDRDNITTDTEIRSDDDLMDVTMEEYVSSIERDESHLQKQNPQNNSQEEDRDSITTDTEIRSDDDLMDVTMEEYVSSFEKGLQPENITNSQKLIKSEKDSINEENKTILIKSEAEVDVRDQLLDLLKDVSSPKPEDTFEDNFNKDKKKCDDWEMKKVQEVIEMLNNESFDDASDSEEVESSVELSSMSDFLEDSLDSQTSGDNLDSSFENFHEEETIPVVQEEEKEEEAENFEVNFEHDLQHIQSKKHINTKHLYIPLERINIKNKNIVDLKHDSDKEIDRLCNLKTLHNKRKQCTTSESSDSSMKPKRKHNSRKDSSTDDSSLSDSGLEILENTLGKDDLGLDLDSRMERFLAKQISVQLTNFNEEDSETDSHQSDKEEDEKTKKINNEKHANCKEKVELTKEQQEKRSWRNDPLLHKTFNISSSSDDDGDPNKSCKKKLSKNRYEHDTDFDMNYTTERIDETDSDAPEIEPTQMKSNFISPIKRNIPLSDTSDSSDSDDIEFIPKKIQPGEKDDLNERTADNSQKGRRNIRALMSDELLTEGTQIAREVEQERVNRLKAKKKSVGSLSQSFCSLSDDGEPYVLDIAEETNEPSIEVHRAIVKRMKPHQLDGLQFMWDSCYESVERIQTDPGSGCILAHCMGLGKTFQVLALVHTLLSYEKTNTNHVLVVCPLSTVNNWKKEADIAFKNIPNNICQFNVISDGKDFNNRIKIVKFWYYNKKSILIMGYEAYETLTNEIKLEKMGVRTKNRILQALVDPGPDLVVCDEGHLLKNKDSRKALALNRIRTKRRIVLTGTPLQNNLMEYYCMVQFVKPNLLGTLKEFKTNFINPISNGQYQDSTLEDIKLMHKRTHVLHKLLKSTIQRVEDTELQQYLPKMIDYAVFVQLSQIQVQLYEDFSAILQNTADIQHKNHKKLIADFGIFQYICTHPQMLPFMEKQRHKRIQERDVITNDKDSITSLSTGGWWKTRLPPDSAKNIQYGNKIVVLKAIIEECEAVGDKLLVFSQTLGELDLIEHFLKSFGTERCASWTKKVDYCRLDGTVRPEKRTVICDNFNDKDNSTMRLLLMSIKVGGLGLNLTAANRVVIMTVSWNPSYDLQSVFRVYRFGQEKAVYVYRLVSLGTMEEKVYQRTINKLATAHRVIDKHQISRHFRSVDLQALYSCQPNADEERPTPNIPEDQMLAKIILKLPCIFKYHEHRALLENKPEDNLTESELASAWEEFRTAQTEKPPVAQNPTTDITISKQLPPPNGPNLVTALDIINTKVIQLSNPSRNDQNGTIQNEPIANKLNNSLKLYYNPPPMSSTTSQQMASTSSSVPNIQHLQGEQSTSVPNASLDFPQKIRQMMSNRAKQITLPIKFPNGHIVNPDNSHSSSTKKNNGVSPLYIVKEKENQWITTKKKNQSYNNTNSTSSDVNVLGNGNITDSNMNIYPTPTGKLPNPPEVREIIQHFQRTMQTSKRPTVKPSTSNIDSVTPRNQSNIRDKQVTFLRNRFSTQPIDLTVPNNTQISTLPNTGNYINSNQISHNNRPILEHNYPKTVQSIDLTETWPNKRKDTRWDNIRTSDQRHLIQLSKRGMDTNIVDFHNKKRRNTVSGESLQTNRVDDKESETSIGIEFDESSTSVITLD